MVFIKLNDALLLFSKWASEGTDVFCIVETDGSSRVSQGKIDRDPAGRLLFLSLEGTAGSVISLDAEGVVFAYADCQN